LPLTITKGVQIDLRGKKEQSMKRLFVTMTAICMAVSISHAQDPSPIREAQTSMDYKHRQWLSKHQSLVARFNRFTVDEDCSNQGYRIPASLASAKNALRDKIAATQIYYDRLIESYHRLLDGTSTEDADAEARVVAARQNLESINEEIAEVANNIKALDEQNITGAAATARQILEMLEGQQKSAQETISLSNGAKGVRAEMRGRIENLKVLISASNRAAGIMRDRYLSEYDSISAFFNEKCRVVVPQ
jgi:hypothetical protein